MHREKLLTKKSLKIMMQT